jgi:hypothetical protein
MWVAVWAKRKNLNAKKCENLLNNCIIKKQLRTKCDSCLKRDCDKEKEENWKLSSNAFINFSKSSAEGK